ncbi:hypothetical protein EV191_102491 [Tamaricihabitans halophyticus]|uniref:DUF6286 domain-containing protein n=1 Tax=Tamaricihabitans halophyticus TaxID=1262583 RepID=A0A4R2R118_9PSEU|nr:DUF6286 domain-containing protein [Tamaricihabitans halophyticus]TCP55279.1 hypothetical protein EV191_102491 [Tamaricihabitans halophyticus]
MRLFVRLLSGLFGLALLGLGALTVGEVGWSWAWPQRAPLLVPWPSWLRYLDGRHWSDTETLVAAGVLAALGLVLLLASAAAKTRDIRLRDPGTAVSVSTSPRALARLVGRHVRAQDAVSGASVTASAKKVKVKARSRLESAGQLRPRLLDSVRELLAELPLARQPRVTVVVTAARERR